MITTSSASAGIPGPRPLPVLNWVGNAVIFMREPVLYMRQLYETYGPIVSLARGSTRFVFAFAPEYNRLLLSDTTLFHTVDNSTMPVPVPENSANARLSSGLTTMNVPKHTQQR